MSGWKAIELIAMVAAVVLGLPIGLYAVLTRKRRAAMRQIRERAAERGWKFLMRHWTGNPTAFRIEGRSRSGLRLMMKAGGTSGYDHGWNATLAVRFPELAGDPDVAILPRGKARGESLDMQSRFSQDLQARVAAVSGLAASALRLWLEGKETPSGVAAFDEAYRVLRLDVSWQPLVDAKLAERIVTWPTDAYALHAMLAWRDPFGFHVEARLPAPANWATICYVVELAEDLSLRLPAGKMPGPPKGILDELLARFLGAR